MVLIVRATKKLRQRLGSAAPDAGESSTTLLGDWYATLLPWRPRQLIMLVNQQTLLPVMLLAPSADVAARIGPAIAAVLTAHRVPASVVEGELGQMGDCRFAATASRSVVGIMNDFTRQADAYRRSEPNLDLLRLAGWLAKTPCSPLFSSHVSPDRELQAFLASGRTR